MRHAAHLNWLRSGAHDSTRKMSGVTARDSASEQDSVEAEGIAPTVADLSESTLAEDTTVGILNNVLE